MNVTQYELKKNTETLQNIQSEFLRISYDILVQNTKMLYEYTPFSEQVNVFLDSGTETFNKILGLSKIHKTPTEILQSVDLLKSMDPTGTFDPWKFIDI